MIGRAADGTMVHRKVEWIVDTGAPFSTVRSSVGAGVQTERTGLSASPTTGDAVIRVVHGPAVEFEVEDQLGVARRVVAEGYLGIKPDDAAGDLLGMQQLAQVGVEITWDPAARRGLLRVD